MAAPGVLAQADMAMALRAERTVCAEGRAPPANAGTGTRRAQYLGRGVDGGKVGAARLATSGRRS